MRIRSRTLLMMLLVITASLMSACSQPAIAPATAQSEEPTMMSVAFPEKSTERAAFTRALDSYRAIGPGYSPNGSPTAIYAKRMALQEAQELAQARLYIPTWKPDTIVWVVILEGHIISNTESVQQESQQNVMKHFVVLDAATAEHIFSTVIPSSQQLDVSSFTRYALPSPAEYTFPEPQPTQVILTPIIRNPPPVAPDGQEIGYPAPPKQP